MQQHRFSAIGSAVLGIAMASLAACAGQSQNTGTGMVPSMPDRGSFPGRTVNAVATPPVTAPVTIPYPYTNVSTTTTYAGPTASPKTSTSTDTGTITVKFKLDTKTGVYDVPEIIKSKLGYSEVLNSAITFPPYKGGTAQIILSDNYTFIAGPFTMTGMDTYPRGENSIDFPMTAGRTWSAAAAHLSYVNNQTSGKKPNAVNTSTNEAADGTYSAQTSSSSLKGGQNQNNYASTTTVLTSAPSIYTISMRAAGFNELTQTFGLPANGKIAVTSGGKKPIPVTRGRVKVPDWYPGAGPIPSPLYSDNYRVVGTVTTPPACASRAGVSATEVDETFANLDPVQGFYDTYTSTYYLATLGTGQFWFSCIIENYTNDNYANGWILSPGDWGGLTQHVTGTETLIAASIKTSDVARAAALMRVPVIPFPNLGFRERAAFERALTRP